MNEQRANIKVEMLIPSHMHTLNDVVMIWKNENSMKKQDFFRNQQFNLTLEDCILPEVGYIPLSKLTCADICNIMDDIMSQGGYSREQVSSLIMKPFVEVLLYYMAVNQEGKTDMIKPDMLDWLKKYDEFKNHELYQSIA